MKFSYWCTTSNPPDQIFGEAQLAADLGFRGLWAADHFMPNEPEPADGPVLECFTMLAALAARIPKLRIGSIVASNTHRNPAVLANMAATIDQISGGRMVLGIGAGWQANEHAAYGMQYGTFGERFDRLEEACQIITSMFVNHRTTVSGRHYQVVDAPCDPKPVQTPLPVLIGGSGEKRTLDLVARYAQEWNTWGVPDFLAAKGAVLDGHCERLGRDPKSIHRTAATMLVISADAAKLERFRSMDLGRPTMVGTPPEIVEIVHAYEAAGVDEIIIPGFSFATPQLRERSLTLFAETVMPMFR